MKKFILGFLSCALIMSAGTLFAESTSTITAIFDRVKLVVNGKQTDTSTLLYDGRTYIQLKGASEAFGAALEWDGNTNTAYLSTDSSPEDANSPASTTAPEPTQAPVSTPKPTPKPTEKPEPTQTPKPVVEYDRFNPAPIGTTQRYVVKSGNSEYTLDVRLNEVIRGDEAWKMVQKNNRYAKAPGEGYEYMIVNLMFDVKKSNTNKKFNVDWSDFDVFSKDDKEYDNIYSGIPSPKLDYELNEGENAAGYLLYLIKYGDKPTLQYDGDYNGGGGIWFKLY